MLRGELSYRTLMERTLMDYALNLLARREHSQLELRRKLLLRGGAPDVITRVLEELERQGLQSDRRFAASYVRMRMARGYGRRRLSLELRERGVDDELIEEVLTVEHDASEWIALAGKVRQKKFGKRLVVSHAVAQRKQMQFLYYRGFTSDEIKAALGGGEASDSTEMEEL